VRDIGKPRSVKMPIPGLAVESPQPVPGTFSYTVAGVSQLHSSSIAIGTEAPVNNMGLDRIPAEIRSMVWKLCLPGPPTITIRKKNHQIYWITSQAVPTPLLHLCKEFRQFSLKRYTAAFESKYHKAIYFNFGSDSIRWPDAHSRFYFKD